MQTNSPAQIILQFLEGLPESVQSNICAVPVLFVDRDHRPRPGDNYLELVRALLAPSRKLDEHRSVILVAGVLDHHLSEVRGLTSDDYLALAKKMPTEFFQMGVLKAPDQNRDFSAAVEEWHDLRGGELSHRAIAQHYSLF